MPHGFIKKFKSQLPVFVAQQLAAIEAAIYARLNQEIEELRQKFLNQCPPPKVLKAISQQLSNLKKVLQKFDNKINKLKPLPDSLEPAIIAGSVVVEILSHMPLPSAIGTPPGPAGGLVIAVPTGVIQQQSNTLVFVRDLVESLENDQKTISGLFDNIDGIFLPLIAKIEQIENLLKRCTENPDLSEEERREILQGAGAFDNEGQSTEEYTASANGRVYTLKVINDPQDNLIAPRRQAIAVDFRGITVLKGPLSFASEPQVLIDELKLRLESFLDPLIGTGDGLVITTAPKAPTPIQAAPTPTSPVKPAPAQQFVYDLSGLDLSFKTFLREKGYKDYVRTGLFQRKRAKTLKRASSKEKREYELWRKQKEDVEKQRQEAQQMLAKLKSD